MKWLREAEREIFFAVHKDEAQAYQDAYKTNAIILSEKCRHHTGLVRKEIMAQLEKPFFFVDDDIRVTFKTTRSIKAVFDLIEHHMKSGASMAGIAPQLFSNFAITPGVNDDPCAIRNKFVATVYGINPVEFAGCPLDVLPVYEDVALVIHAIRTGHGTIVTYAATHSNVSPPKGGCNSWRDEKITLDSLEALVKLYPDVCTVKETKNTTHSQHIGVGLKVAWSKIKKVS